MSKRRKSRKVGSPSDKHRKTANEEHSAAKRSLNDVESALKAGHCGRAYFSLLNAQREMSRAIEHEKARSPDRRGTPDRMEPEARKISRLSRRVRGLCVRDRVKKG